MVRPAKSLALAALLFSPAAAPAVEWRREAGEASVVRVEARGYTVRLTGSGSLLEISTPRGLVYRDVAPGGHPWRARSGTDWGNTSGCPASVGFTDVREPAGLRLRFRHTGCIGAAGFDALTDYHFRDDGSFTTRLELSNGGAAPMDLVAFPAPLRLDPSLVQRVVFPFQRGIVSELPAEGETLFTRVPAGFAEFVAFETPAGVLAVSMPLQVPPPDQLPETVETDRTIAVYHSGSGKERAVRCHIDRTVSLAPGRRLDSGTVLFQVRGTTVEAARSHWSAGTTGSFPALARKLPAEQFRRLSQSVLLKYPDSLGGPSNPRVKAILAKLPDPSLLHLCSYMPGGHDSHYPDYLPPDAAFGSTEELRGAIADLRGRGVMVMPYTNPTWWDAGTPTLERLGTGIALRQADGTPREETYGPRRGLVIDPRAPGVAERLAANAAELRSLGADFLFEDQVGAREAIPGDPGYSAGLLRNAAADARILPLVVECGHAALAEFVVGFSGHGALPWEQPTLARTRWRRYPLMQVMANGNAATWPHNLAPEQMVRDRSTLRDIVAFGSNLAWDLNGGTDDPLFAACVRLQARVLSRNFGETITGLEDRRDRDGSTLLTFANGNRIFASWTERPLPCGAHVVSPNGFAAVTADGATLAGQFESLDGKALPENDRGRLLLREGSAVEFLLPR